MNVSVRHVTTHDLSYLTARWHPQVPSQRNTLHPSLPLQNPGPGRRDPGSTVGQVNPARRQVNFLVTLACQPHTCRLRHFCIPDTRVAPINDSPRGSFIRPLFLDQRKTKEGLPSSQRSSGRTCGRPVNAPVPPCSPHLLRLSRSGI